MMLDKQQPVPAMDNTLKILEDHSIPYLMRSENYRNIENILKNEDVITQPHVNRLLHIFTHDLNKDTKYAVIILKLLSTLLKKIKLGDNELNCDLLPTAFAIMGILSKTAPLHKVQSLQHLCLDTFLSFPDEVFLKLGKEHRSDVLALADQYLISTNVEFDIKIMVLDMTVKVLELLKEVDLKLFVREGLSVWFARVVPLIFTNSPLQETALQITEIIIEHLADVDYSENAQWGILFKNISTVDKYPMALKTMLINGDPVWHRAWCCVVKLLGTKLHKSANLINSLLAVLENAFKMSMVERCKAFHCWKVLIENFSLNMDQFFTSRRIKLLLIPLIVNNAKEEKSATSKFDTWWFLLRLLQPKIDQYMDSIVIPFLQFCFGQIKLKEGQTAPVIPGMTFPKVKTLAVQALVEIVGHTDCNRCLNDSFDKLPNAILNPTTLISHLHNWLHSFQEVTILLSEMNEDEREKYTKCLYWSLIKNINSIQDVETQEVVYRDFLKMLTHLALMSEGNDRVGDLLFNTIVPSLLHPKSGLSSLDNKFRGVGEVGLQHIFKLLLSSAFTKFYGKDNKEAICKLKTFVNVGISHSPDGFSKWLLRELPQKGDFVSHSLNWWTALAEFVSDSNCVLNEDTYEDILIWPITKMEYFSEVHTVAGQWCKLYTRAKGNVPKDSKIHSALLNIYMLHYKDTQPINVFTARIMPLTISSIVENDIQRIDSLEKDLMILKNISEKLSDVSEKFFNEIANDFSVCLSILLGSITKINNSDIITNIIQVSVNLVKVIFASSKINEKLKEDYVSLLLNSTEEALKNSSYDEKVKDLIKYCSSTSIVSLKQKCQELLNIPKSIKPNLPNEDQAKMKTPKIKNTPTKPKSTGKIVKKVMEGNEEFVVVKSNWKFNPKKLTEHQKEVLSKKRDDIPALYQDLSQSQDEIKMKSWKVPGGKSDSQDMSSSMSSSRDKSMSSHQSPLNILKDIPNREICPNVVKAVLKDDVNIDKNTNLADSDILKENNVANNQVVTTPKSKNSSLKSPRMTITEKINKSVKMLMNVSPSSKLLSLNKTNTENAQTPDHKSVHANFVMSAPPKLDSERPSRTKRKPKKLESDFEVFNVKRKRNSLNSDSKTDSSSDQDVEIVGVMCIQPTHQSNTEKHQIKETLQINDKSNELQTSNETTHSLVETTTQSLTPCISLDDDDPNDKNKYIKEKNYTNIESETVLNEVNNAEKVLEAQKINTENSEKPMDVDTPKPENKQKNTPKPSTASKKKRLEMQLAIDMVEGHPLLTPNEETRPQRKARLLNESQNKTRSDKTPSKEKASIDATPKSKELKNLKNNSKHSNTLNSEEKTKKKTKHPICNSNSKVKLFSQDKPELHSEDFIESSQESPVSTPNIAIKSSKRSKKVADSEKHKTTHKSSESSSNSESELDILLAASKNVDECVSDLKNKSEICKDLENFNNSKATEHMSDESFATMSTQPISEKVLNSISNELIDKKIEDKSPLVSEIIIEEKKECQQKFSEETIAEMDTEPFNPKILESQLKRDDVIVIDDNSCDSSVLPVVNLDSDSDAVAETDEIIAGKCISKIKIKNDDLPLCQDENADQNICNKTEKDAFNDSIGAPSSPFIDDKERDSEFLNNTYDISPIKATSPLPRDASPVLEENSNDFVVITLTSPIKSNDQQADKCDSPEIFTNEKVSPDKISHEKESSVISDEVSPTKISPAKTSPKVSPDKISPDKRDQSPPRTTTTGSAGSPSSLSLRKNRAQLRPSGRGAQMLGLCQPGSFYMKMAVPENVEHSPVKNIVRRNLKTQYDENEIPCEEADEADNFLNLTKELPLPSTSPSVPILKRKLCEIADETTQSPASKRKRVSFHDPPVSTTVSVQKYIEETTRSPQRNKNKEPKNRPIHSRKRLHMTTSDSEAITSDSSTTSGSENEDEAAINTNNETDSLADTPVAVIVTKDQLTNTQPVYPNLIDCTDSIENIVADLTTDSMKEMFLAELKVIVTVGDLAKLTELEVERLGIKTPKAETARKALLKYEETLKLRKQVAKSVEVSHMEIQTEFEEDYFWTTLKEKTSKEVIDACLEKKEDFVKELSCSVSQEIKLKMTEDLPMNTIEEILCQRLKVSSDEESSPVFTKLVDKYSKQFLDAILAQVSTDTILEKVGLDNIERHLLKSLSAGQLVQLCTSLLQKKIPVE